MTTPREIAIAALLAGGVFFVFVGAVGVIRLPDLYTRTHAASKSDTLGVVLSLGATTLVFESFSMRLKVFALLLFMLLTTPTATHAIARAAFDQGIDPWTLGTDSGEDALADSDGRIGSDGEADDRTVVDEESDDRTAADGGES